MMSRCRLLVPAIGLGAGAATSFLGLGGGAIIVPLLMIAVGLPFKEAVGTSLAAVLVISTVGVIPCRRCEQRRVDGRRGADGRHAHRLVDRWPRAGSRSRSSSCSS